MPASKKEVRLDDLVRDETSARAPTATLTCSFWDKCPLRSSVALELQVRVWEPSIALGNGGRHIGATTPISASLSSPCAAKSQISPHTRELPRRPIYYGKGQLGHKIPYAVVCGTLHARRAPPRPRVAHGAGTHRAQGRPFHLDAPPQIR